MKRLRLMVVLVCFGFPTLAAGQSTDATDTAPPSVRLLNEWSACQRDFVTPRLQSNAPIPFVVEGAHARCLSLEQRLKAALSAEHGPDGGASIFASVKEATDQIMCGLLTSTRMSGDKKIAFDSAADCLAGNVRTTP